MTMILMLPQTPPLPEGQLRPNRKQLGSEATGALKGCPEGTEGWEFLATKI